MTMSGTLPSSFAKSLFLAEIHEQMVFPYPRLAADEQQKVDDLIARFGEVTASYDPRAAEFERWVGDDLIAALGEAGLLGLHVPERYGGQGLSQTGYCKVFEAVAALDPALSVVIGVHQSIGYKGITLFGSDEQKQRFLPELASGRMLAGFAPTETSAGSDAYRVQSRATLQLAGGEGYMRDAPYEKTLRDIRIFPIFEGANDVMRAYVAFNGPAPRRARLSASSRRPSASVRRGGSSATSTRSNPTTTPACSRSPSSSTPITPGRTTSQQAPLSRCRGREVRHRTKRGASPVVSLRRRRPAPRWPHRPRRRRRRGRTAPMQAAGSGAASTAQRPPRCGRRGPARASRQDLRR